MINSSDKNLWQNIFSGLLSRISLTRRNRNDKVGKHESKNRDMNPSLTVYIYCWKVQMACQSTGTGERSRDHRFCSKARYVLSTSRLSKTQILNKFETSVLRSKSSTPNYDRNSGGNYPARRPHLLKE